MNDVIDNQQAKQNKLFYVVASLVIVDRQSQACLMLKRSDREKVYPGKWAFPGGKLEHKDVITWLQEQNKEPLDGINGIFGQLAKREAQEECGLDVHSDGNTIVKNKVFIRPDKVPVVMVTIPAEYIGGEVVLEEGSFTEYAWVKRGDIDNLDRIAGSEEELNKAFVYLEGISE